MGFEDVTETILRYAQPLVPVPQALDRLKARLCRMAVEKGVHLCRAGDEASTLYFVASGVVRYYYLVDGCEHTGQFFGTGMFCADVRALTTGAPAMQNFDALSACDLVAIPKAALLRAYDEDHAFERFGRKIMEEVVAGSQRRSASLLMRSAEDRYGDLASSRPDILLTVPQYIVASYLGITPESLSRIRGRRVRMR